MESLDILDVIGKDFKIKKISNGLYSTVEHDSLRIWKDTNSWYWYKNNVGGDAINWLKYRHHLTDEQINERYEVYDYSTDPFKVTTLNKYTITDDVDIHQLYGKKEYSDYIRNRGINYDTFQKYNLEMINNYYALIPLFDRVGKRIGAMHRKLDDALSGPKYKKYFTNTTTPFIFNLKKLNNRNKCDTILVFEGAWSVMRFEQVLGDTVLGIATLSNKFNDTYLFELLNGFNNVFFVLDNDVAGQQLIKKHPTLKYIIPSIYPDELTDEQIVKVSERIKSKCQPIN